MKTTHEHPHDYTGLGGRVGSAKGEGNISRRLSRMNRVRAMTGATLLDIGCGNGAYTMRMAPGFEHTVGIDIEPDRLQDFRDQCSDPSVEIVQRSAADTGLPDESVDVATAIEVFEHLGPALSPAIKELHRVMRPLATLYVTTPNRWWPFEQHGWVWHDRRHAGWTLPGLTWVPPLHRRLSHDAVFTRETLDAAVLPLGFASLGITYMMPPLDGSPRLRQLVGPAMSRLEESRLRRLSQTLITAYVRC